MEARSSTAKRQSFRPTDDGRRGAGRCFPAISRGQSSQFAYLDIGAEAADLNMEKLKVGIAGYGIVGRRRKSVIDARPDMEVVAVCDRAFERDGISGALKHHCDFRDLLQNKLDILFVC